MVERLSLLLIAHTVLPSGRSPRTSTLVMSGGQRLITDSITGPSFTALRERGTGGRRGLQNSGSGSPIMRTLGERGRAEGEAGQ